MTAQPRLTEHAGSILRRAFGEDVFQEEGWLATKACEIVGITYRQLDYWTRTDLVRPSIAVAHGSGTRRLYSRDDIVTLCVIRTLLNLGLALQVVRGIVAEMQQDPPPPGSFLVVRTRLRGGSGGTGEVSEACVTADEAEMVRWCRRTPCIVLVIPEIPEPPNLSETTIGTEATEHE